VTHDTANARASKLFATDSGVSERPLPGYASIVGGDASLRGEMPLELFLGFFLWDVPDTSQPDTSQPDSYSVVPRLGATSPR